MKKTPQLALILFLLIGFVEILGQPSISQDPQNQSVTIGQTAMFTVTATGNGSLTYQWYKDAVLIASATSDSYTTPATILGDNGSEYYCIVTDVDGATQSATATLTVSYENSRVTDQLQVLYDFDEGTGTVINDVSGVGLALDLSIDNSGGVTWTPEGLNIHSQVRIKSTETASKIYTACTASNEITFEAWLIPSNTVQRNLYNRVVHLANDNKGETNFTVAQYQDNYYAFLRNNNTPLNGDPAVVDTAIVEKIHYVYTRDNLGNIVTYINGVKSSEEVETGDFSNWNSAYYLFLGNAAEDEHYWEGTYYLTAFYSKALSEVEVGQNYNFGVSSDSFPYITENPTDQTVSVGGAATFSVTAIGTAPLTYQWKKDGSDISGANSSSYTTPSLSLDDDNSTYSCYISNGDGNATSSSAKVTVIAPDTRIVDGIIALYDFREGTGSVITDKSSVDTKIDLSISDENDISWSQNGLEIVTEASIISGAPAAKLHSLITSSNEFSVEMWIKPANNTQTGSARILTFSQDGNFRNFSVGQDADRYEFRVRTDGSDDNGFPAVYSPNGSASAELQHVVVVVSTNNRARIFVNGQEVANVELANNLSTWNSSYRLSLANELIDSRPWLGTYNYVAVFDKWLSPAEVEHNYNIGPFGLSNIEAPTGLIVSESTIGKVDLAWTDNASNEDGFVIERSTGDTLNFTQVASVSTDEVSYSDTSVTEGTSYYYRVKAFNSFSNKSSEYSNYPTLITQINKPTELSVDASVLGEISLNWTDNTESESGYIVERGIGDPIVYTVIDTITQSSYTDNTVDEGVFYSYRVKAYNSLVESDYSNVSNVRSKASFVSAPTDFEASIHPTFGVPVLSWTDNAFNETGYVIERQVLEVGAVFIPVDTLVADATTFTDGTVQDSTIYKYRIYSFNDEYVSEKVEVDVTVLVGIETEEAVPTDFNLSQNYPNPFNPSTTIKFGIPTSADVQIILYNLLGQELFTIVDNNYSAGNHFVNFDASELTSGIYIYTIIAKGNKDKDFVQSKKMILLK